MNFGANKALPSMRESDHPMVQSCPDVYSGQHPGVSRKRSRNIRTQL